MKKQEPLKLFRSSCFILRTTVSPINIRNQAGEYNLLRRKRLSGRAREGDFGLQSLPPAKKRVTRVTR